MTSSDAVILLHDGHIDLANRRVVRGEEVAHLTPIEQALLIRLAGAGGDLVHMDTLLQDVWGYAPGVESRAPYTAIQRLRGKIEGDPKTPRHLLSVYGGGYRFIAAPPPVVPPPVHLPVEPCPYFGRSGLLATLRVALGEPGIVTLHGPGGMGKSRTALRCAHHLVEGGAVPSGGILFVDAETCAEGDELLDAALSAAGLSWPPGRDRSAAEDHLAAALGRRGRCLLVLDGVERLGEAVGALVSRLWSAAPQITVLVTSRRPLGLAPERVFPLAPLAQDVGVELFLDRARRVRWGFALSDADRAALGALIGGPLDGMPLGIELAAARVAVLSVAQLCEGLSARALRDPRRHGPRHASLDAALSWSFDMLDGEEARGLGWLSLFQGSPDLGDVQAVLGRGLPDTDLVDLLQRLADAALLTVVPTEGGTRYRLLAPIRERAGELLGPSGAAATAAHLTWAEETAEALAARIHSPTDPSARQRLPWVRPDLLAAVDRAHTDQPDRAGRLCRVTDHLTALHDPIPLRRSRLDRALGAGICAAVRVQLLCARADLLQSGHRWDAALTDLQAAQELCASGPDRSLVHLGLGRQYLFTGELDRAAHHLERARDQPDAPLRLGYLHQVQGAHDLAQEYYEEAIAAFETADDGVGAARARGNLSLTVGELGDVARSQRLAREMLEAAQQVGHGPLETTALQLLGSFALRACDLDEAEGWMKEAARLARRFGDPDRAYNTDLNLAELAWERGDLVAAARILGDCLRRPVSPAVLLFAQVLRGALEHDRGDLAAAEDALRRAWDGAAALGVGDRRVFAGLSLGPALAELGRAAEAVAVLDEVERRVRAQSDQEGIRLVALGRLHLDLAAYRADPTPALRRELLRTWRKLPPPDGLLLRRAHRLFDRVGQRAGLLRAPQA